MGRISMGLMSMVRVMGALPIIRSPTGGAAEMLAHSLCATLRENIAPRGPAHAVRVFCNYDDDNDDDDDACNLVVSYLKKICTEKLISYINNRSSTCLACRLFCI